MLLKIVLGFSRNINFLLLLREFSITFFLLRYKMVIIIRHPCEIDDSIIC